MCGIAGYVNHCGTAAEAALADRMLAAIAHRGPDSQGVRQCGPVVLGAARLAILDGDERAAQPFEAPSRAGFLAYNGELYNHSELRRELAGKVDFQTTSDSEVIAAAIAEYGVAAAVRRFDGMFALAYFDDRSGDLWLARDRLGIKPLYVTRTARAFVFGSEIKALLAHPQVAAAPNMLAILNGLLLDNLEEPWTAFSDIQAMPRGQIWRIGPDGRTTVDEYWNLLDALEPDRVRANGRLSLADASAQLDERLGESVRTHLQSDGPVAVFVSGGLDSGMLSAYAHRLVSDLQGFAADVEGAKPELERALAVGRHLNLPIEPVRVSFDDYLRAWPEAVFYEEIPLCVASDPAVLLLSRAVQRAGRKVALTGEGADELLCGYPWQAQAGPAWRWPRVAKWLWARTGRGRRLHELLPPDPDTRTVRTFANFDWPDPTALMRETCGFHGGQKHLRHADLLAKVSGLGRPVDQGRLAACLNSMYGHLQALLLRTDRMAMAASVEARVPFLSNAVIDLALHLPMPLKWRAGQSKRVLRQTALGYFPESVVHAPKWGFSTSRKPFRAALPLIREGNVPNLLQWSRRDTDRLLDLLRDDPKPVVLFLVASLELWSRIFLDGQSPQELGERLAAAADTVRETEGRAALAAPPQLDRLARKGSP